MFIIIIILILSRNLINVAHVCIPTQKRTHKERACDTLCFSHSVRHMLTRTAVRRLRVACASKESTPPTSATEMRNAKNGRLIIFLIARRLPEHTKFNARTKRRACDVSVGAPCVTSSVCLPAGLRLQRYMLLLYIDFITYIHTFCACVYECHRNSCASRSPAHVCGIIIIV